MAKISPSHPQDPELWTEVMHRINHPHLFPSSLSSKL